jgi:hypothetical protein
MPTDNFSKLGVELGKSAKALGEAIQDPMHALQALRELAGNTKDLSLLPIGTAIELGKNKKALDDLSEALVRLQKEETAAKKNLDDISKQASVAKGMQEAKTFDINGNQATRQVDRVAEQKTVAENTLKAIKEQQTEKAKEVEAVKESATKYYEALAKASFENLSKGLSKALAEASVTAAKGMSDILKQAGGVTGAIDSQLAQRSLGIQIGSIEASYENSTKLAILNLTLEETNLLAKQTAIREQVKANGNRLGPENASKLADIANELDANAKAQKALASGDKGVMALKAKLDPGSQSALAKLGSLPNELFGKLQAVAGLMAQKGNEQFKGQIEKNIIGPAAKAKEVSVREGKSLTMASSEIDALQKTSGIYSSILQDEKDRISMALLINKYDQEAADISTKVAIAEAVINKYKSQGIKSEEDKLLYTEAVRTSISQTTDLEVVRNNRTKDTNLTQSKNLQERLAGQKSITDMSNTFETSRKANAEQFNTIELDRQSKSLSYLKDVGAIEEVDLIKSQTKIDLITEANKYYKDTYDLSIARTSAEDTIKNKIIEQQLLIAKNPEQAAALNAQLDILTNNLDRTTQSYKDQKTNIDAANNSRVTAITLTSAHKELIAGQADQMSKLVSITQGLSDVFGEMGNNIGKAAEAMLTLSQNSEKRAEAEKAFSGPGQEKELADLKTKHAKAELKDISSVASASKKFFNEKSLGYRLLDGVEKATAAMSLAREITTLAGKAAAWWAAIPIKVAAEGAETAAAAAGAATRAPLTYGEIVGQYLKSIPAPWGMVAGVAAGAFFLSLLGNSSSGSSTPPIDQGTLAGTGQSADGSTRAGGVLGDSTATAKSVTDSIDTLSKVFFGTMGSSSSNLIKHLKGIQDNTYNTAKALGAAGVLGSSNPFGVSGTGSSGGISTGIGILDNILGSIFGGKTSTSITGSGIVGGGTSTALAQGGGFAGYTNIHKETEGGWFGSSSSSDNTVYSQLDKSIQKGLKGIFQNFNATLLDTAESLGKSKSEIQNILDTTSLSLSVSNVGLTGTEFAAKLSAEVSVQLNAIAEKAYPFLSLYTKVGEESFQVAVRLIKDSETVTQGLKMVGAAIDSSFTTIDKIGAQQQVINNFGGTADTFATAIQAYYDALFTDSDKLIVSLSSVQGQLADLGIGGISTNEQLKALIATLDPTSELYASLVNLVPAFTNVTAAMGKLQDDLDSLMGQVYDLTDNSAASLALKRAKTLKDTDPSLKILQKYVFALEDLNTAETKLTAIRKSNLSITNTTISSLKTSINTLDGFITGLNNFNNSLVLGASSTLTPGQKYQAAQQQFSDILATATSGAITPEQQKAKDAAIGQIQSSANAFLDSSKMYNASSYQYSIDFALVQSAITTTSASLTEQKTTSQIQLDTLQAQSDLMQLQIDAIGEVSTTIQDTSTALQNVTNASAIATDLSIQAAAEQATNNAKISQILIDSGIQATINASNTISSSIGYASDANLNALKTVTDAIYKIPANTSSSSGGGGGGGIISGILKTADNITNSVAKIFGWASGGIAPTGFNLVGEHGPELVDFKTPGRVYNATNTEKLFKAPNANINADTLNELRALRAEIQQLREQQKTETGHLINAQYDSQNQNAQAVTDAVVTTAATQIWNTKLQNSVVLV